MNDLSDILKIEEPERTLMGDPISKDQLGSGRERTGYMSASETANCFDMTITELPWTIEVPDGEWRRILSTNGEVGYKFYLDPDCPV